MLLPGLIISVGEARKLLGVRYGNTPDEAVAGFIRELSLLADSLLCWATSSTKRDGDV